MRLEHFELIDRVLSLSLADRRIMAEATVPTAGTILAGHFPGHPVMPGVLLVEAMAQASGWLAMAAVGFERMALLAQIRSAKLRTAVMPGELLTVAAELAHEGSGFAVARASISGGGKRICDAELTLRLVRFPSEVLRTACRSAAARLGAAVGSSFDE